MINPANRFRKRSYLTLLLAVSCSSFTATATVWGERISLVGPALELTLTPASGDAVEEIRVARRPVVADVMLKSPEELKRMTKSSDRSAANTVITEMIKAPVVRSKPADPPSLPPRSQPNHPAPNRPAPIHAAPAPIRTLGTTTTALNDGWVARDAMNNRQPLSDPQPQQHSESVPQEEQVVEPEFNMSSEVEMQMEDFTSELELFDPVVSRLPASEPGPEPGIDNEFDLNASEIADDSPATETFSDEVEVEVEVEAEQDPGIVVRRLRIDRDGTPRSDGSSETPSRSLKRLEVIADEDVTSIEGLGRDESEQLELAPRAATREKRSAPSRSVGDQFDAGDEFAEPLPESAEPQVVAEPPRVIVRDYTGRPTEPIQLTPTVQRMQGPIRNCLLHYYGQTEIADGRSNWGMIHAMMAWGIDTKIIANHREYSAIAWIAGNNACRGQKLLELNSRGGVQVKSGVGLQGHQAQFLTVCALSNIPIDYPMYVGKTKFAIRDIVNAEMADCKSGDELTFNLISLVHYLDTDQTWVTPDRQRWDFERLIREELTQPIVGATCGGTHRLMAYDHALRKRRIEGKPISGQWSRAETFTTDFVKYAYTLQNRDGSMSTRWFDGREDNGNLDRKIQTTGHIVEWLLTTTPDSELQDPRLVKAIEFLLASMWNEREHEWEIGPKGHALRSLAMFYDRAYKVGPAWKTQSTASRQPASRR